MIALNALKCARGSLLKTRIGLAFRASRFTSMQMASSAPMLAMTSRFAFASAAEEEATEEQKVKNTNNMTDEQALEKIKKWVSENKVCLFMKGEPREPRCGFSNFVVQTLKFYKIKDYKSIDVLKYEVIRKQAKAYSNWPTFPQLYIDGKLIGGSDIVSEMHKDGSLGDLFRKHNLIES